MPPILKVQQVYAERAAANRLKLKHMPRLACRMAGTGYSSDQGLTGLGQWSALPQSNPTVQMQRRQALHRSSRHQSRLLHAPLAWTWY